MNISIINCFETYNERVSIINEYFRLKRHNVTVYTSNFEHSTKKYKLTNDENYVYVNSPKYFRNISIKRLYSHYITSKRIFDILYNEKTDILWVMIPPNSFVKRARIFKRDFPNIKLIFDVIDMWPETFPIRKSKFFFFTLWRELRDKNINYGDIVFTECRLFQSILSKSVNLEKMSTLYLARHETNEKYNIPILDDKVISLCYLGSINHLIDIDEICRIASSIKSRYKDVCIHIVGDGEKKDIFLNELESRKIKYYFHGKVYNKDQKTQIFNKCHFGLNIMKKSVFVGLTMKSIDYFEAGLPIINNIKGDTWDFVNDNYIGYNATDDNDIYIYDIKMRDSVRKFYSNNFTVNSFSRTLDKSLSKIEV